MIWSTSKSCPNFFKHTAHLNRCFGGHKFYVHLKKIGFPKDRYRLLCYNCNMSRGRYGYCPHQLQMELFAMIPMLVRRID